MNYKYPPIYKYALLFAIIYMFLKYQNMMNGESLIVNTSIIVLFVSMLDYILINKHPKFFGNTATTKNEDDIEQFEDADYELGEDDSVKYDDIDVYADEY